MTRPTLAAVLTGCLAGLPLVAVATTYTLTIEDDVIRHPGDLVSFVTRMDDANGLSAITLEIGFDPTVLALNGVGSTVFLDADDHPGECQDFPPADCFTAEGHGDYVGIIATSFLGLSGQPPFPLFTLDFTVLPTAPVGDTGLAYRMIELVDADLESVPAGDITASGATLTVRSAPAPAPAAAPWLLLLPGLAALGARRRRPAG